MAEKQAHEQRSTLATPEEMQAAIEQSGYMLEGRTAGVMAERGFFVEPNRFTPHPAEPGKAIEIDIAGRYFEFVNEKNNDIVSASVLVECKNNSQPFAFFVRRQQVAEINDSRILYSGYPSFSLDQETGIQIPLHKLLNMKDWHRYCKAQEVATQYCTFERSDKNKCSDKKKFKAGPNENYSRSFSRLAVAASSNSVEGVGLQNKSILVQLSYPVVIFEGPIYRVEDNGGKPKLEAVDRLQLHHSTTVNEQVIPVQIDVVRESDFPKLMEEILEELKTLSRTINHSYEKLLKSAIDQKRVASQKPARKTTVPRMPSL